MKVAFHTPTLDVRGTCVAVYDYARYNEELLGNESVIFVPHTGRKKSDTAIVRKFDSRFKIIYYDTPDQMDVLLGLEDVDLFYAIKYGVDDGIVSKTVRTAVHCVFDMSQPHGDVYSAVSKSLADKFGMSSYVPHMISLEPDSSENLRLMLGIPREARVFGRHGGEDTFNLPFVKTAINRIASTNPDIYFLFVNTPSDEIEDLENIIFLPKISTQKEKNRFISTCDAHLECSVLGHTFGLSIGEFSVHNKPIICYNGYVWNRSHLDILDGRGLYFQTEHEFERIILDFDGSVFSERDINYYREYSPENVMSAFKREFIDSM